MTERPRRRTREILLGEGCPTVLNADLGQGSTPIFMGLIHGDKWVCLDYYSVLGKKIKLWAEIT